MKNIKNNKSNVTFIFAILVTTIIGFFIIINFLYKNVDVMSTETQDLACKFLTTTKEFSKLSFGFYIYEFKNKCVVDKITIDNVDKDSTLKPIAESMRRCWYKYGEGKNDFMSNWNTIGQYCFECAEINYKDKNSKTYTYTQLMDWMKNNKFKSKDGTKKTYSDYLNVLEYKNLNKQSDSDVFKTIENAKFVTDSGDDYTKDFKNIYINMYTSSFDILNSYRVKKIDPKEKNYIVFKYVRVEKDLVDKFFEIASTSTDLAEKGITGYALLRPFKTVGMVKNTPKNIKNGLNNLKNLNVNAKDLKVGEEIWYKSGKKMVKHKVKAISNTGKITLQALSGSKQVFTFNAANSKTLVKSVGKFSGKKLTKKAVKSALKVFKKNPFIGSALAIIGVLAVNTDRNYIQYVEILNQEQYFRTCGTLRYPNK